MAPMPARQEAGRIASALKRRWGRWVSCRPSPRCRGGSRPSRSPARRLRRSAMAIAGRVQRQPETLGAAGRLQQRLGARQVVRVWLERSARARAHRRQPLRCRHRAAFEQPLGDRLSFDRERQRLAHARIVQRIARATAIGPWRRRTATRHAPSRARCSAPATTDRWSPPSASSTGRGRRPRAARYARARAHVHRGASG